MTGGRGRDGTTRLRPFRDADAERLTAIYAAAVRAMGADHYAPEQLDAWAGLAPSPDAHRARALDGRRVVVAEIAGIAVAYADLEPDGHVDHLYCAPEAAGRGVATALLAEVESLARAAGIARLHAEASDAALSVFRRAGFRILHRRDLVVGGVPIHNHAVEKNLARERDPTVRPARGKPSAPRPTRDTAGDHRE